MATSVVFFLIVNYVKLVPYWFLGQLNTGNLVWMLRARYLVDAVPFNKIAGQPFKIREITGKIQELLGESGPYELGFAPASGLSGG